MPNEPEVRIVDLRVERVTIPASPAAALAALPKDPNEIGRMNWAGVKPSEALSSTHALVEVTGQPKTELDNFVKNLEKMGITSNVVTSANSSSAGAARTFVVAEAGDELNSLLIKSTFGQSYDMHARLADKKPNFNYTVIVSNDAVAVPDDVASKLQSTTATNTANSVKILTPLETVRAAVVKAGIDVADNSMSDKAATTLSVSVRDAKLLRPFSAISTERVADVIDKNPAKSGAILGALSALPLVINTLNTAKDEYAQGSQYPAEAANVYAKGVSQLLGGTATGVALSPAIAARTLAGRAGVYGYVAAELGSSFAASDLAGKAYDAARPALEKGIQAAQDKAQVIANRIMEVATANGVDPKLALQNADALRAPAYQTTASTPELVK